MPNPFVLPVEEEKELVYQNKLEQFLSLEAEILKAKQKIKELQQEILEPLKIKYSSIEMSILELFRECEVKSLEVGGFRVRLERKESKRFGVKTMEYLTQEQLAEVMTVSVSEHIKVTQTKKKEVI